MTLGVRSPAGGLTTGRRVRAAMDLLEEAPAVGGLGTEGQGQIQEGPTRAGRLPAEAVEEDSMVFSLSCKRR